MQGTIWSHLCDDVSPEDALKKGFLGNNSVGNNLRQEHCPAAQTWPLQAPSPSSHQVVTGMGELHTLGCDAPGVLSEPLMEMLACLNIPGVCFGCCCC